MDIAIRRLTVCIGRALQHTQFRNVFRQRLDSSVMGQFYARKMRRQYCLSNTDAIGVRESEITHLVDELEPLVNRYRLSETGAVGNGFYELLGSAASPRLPAVEDCVKTNA